jgi:hypothetical protein
MNFLSKSLRHYMTRNLISSSLPSRASREPSFWSDISLLIPLGSLRNKNFLASHMSIDTESFQRTDISTQPLGPTILDVINCGFRDFGKSLKLASTTSKIEPF